VQYVISLNLTKLVYEYYPPKAIGGPYKLEAIIILTQLLLLELSTAKRFASRTKKMWPESTYWNFTLIDLLSCFLHYCLRTSFIESPPQGKFLEITLPPPPAGGAGLFLDFLNNCQLLAHPADNFIGGLLIFAFFYFY